MQARNKQLLLLFYYYTHTTEGEKLDKTKD